MSAHDGQSLAQILYPEIGAGGFSRTDGNIEFFGRVNALIEPNMTVLDFGAGRGKDVTDDPVRYRRDLRNLKGKVEHVVGVDIDPAVESNPSLDQGLVVGEDSHLPLADASIDLVVSDFCFEHLRSPEFVAAELGRVLKVGGWICARTPNRWGYIGIGACSVPNVLHTRILDRLQPARNAQDVFPTEYRLNTLKQIRRQFPGSAYDDYSYAYNTEPAYFGNSLVATRIAKHVIGTPPAAFSALLFVFLRKRE